MRADDALSALRAMKGRKYPWEYPQSHHIQRLQPFRICDAFANSCFNRSYQNSLPSTAFRTREFLHMDIGYARVSTEDQFLDQQIDALTKAGVDRDWIYEEHISGAKTKRPKLDECLKSLRPGDRLVVWKLDRLGRNLGELIKIAERLSDKDIDFCSLTEGIDTKTPGGRLLYHFLGAIAEFERALISERTKAGLEAARKRGIKGGRPPKLSDDQCKTIYDMASDGSFEITEIAKAFEVNRATVYRAIERHKRNKTAALPPPKPGSPRADA